MTDCPNHRLGNAQVPRQGRRPLNWPIRGAIVAVVSLWWGPALASDPAMCWTPEQLRNSAAEAGIRKNIAAAYVAFPAGKAHPVPRGPHFAAGAIRRVELPANVKKVALTFDLCEQPYEITGYQGDIVDYLRDQKVPATFFAGGKWMLTHRQRSQQIMADPRFELANHAWEHRNFRVLGESQALREINGAQRAYEITLDDLRRRSCRSPWTKAPAHTGIPPQMTLFRFPFGACNDMSLRLVNERGLMAIQWDVSSADPWKGQTAQRMIQYVLERTRSGSIIIFHANGRGWNTGAALPRIIAGLKKRGFSFDTVSGLLATPGAKPVVSSACFDARPGDSNRYDDLARRLEVKYQEFYRRHRREPGK